ncbi:MAG TPA: hypothetical protein PKE63_08880 [Lacibacter sp.]|nr:hypothetical protein [Lacibacter sp.]HMO89882.1 hypothetical protein [Lacibacter sp.]HMP87376.1 hypothetical protein [Lacibacter sp.]
MSSIHPVRVLFVAIVLTVSVSAAAQETQKKQVLYAANVVTPRDLPVPASRPPSATTRGYCYLMYTNYTGFFVDIWVDSMYQGRIAPYINQVRLDIWVPGKWTEVYMATTDGKLFWKTTAYCNDSRVIILNGANPKNLKK